MIEMFVHIHYLLYWSWSVSIYDVLSLDIFHNSLLHDVTALQTKEIPARIPAGLPLQDILIVY